MAEGKAHRNISFLKSVSRIAGYVTLLSKEPNALFAAVGMLIFSEFIGVLEEL